MQETRTVGPWIELPKDNLSGQSVVALLALVGSRKLGMNELRERTKLSQSGFRSLITWLQREYLVDVVSNLEGSRVEERAELTEKGEAFLLSMLETTCELPELH